MRKLPTLDMSGDTYYVVLGVPETATQAEIKRAYRHLIRRVHPDKFPDASPVWKIAVEQNSRKVIEAYYVLSDSTKRSFYDKQLARYRQQRVSAPPPPLHPRTATTSPRRSYTSPSNPRPHPQADQKGPESGFMRVSGGIMITAAVLLTLFNIFWILLFPWLETILDVDTN
jgi:curved DNA-binding protein CbpA